MGRQGTYYGEVGTDTADGWRRYLGEVETEREVEERELRRWQEQNTESIKPDVGRRGRNIVRDKEEGDFAN